MVSAYLNRTVHAGATLEVAAPLGDFVLDDGSGPVVLISAGIGVTPVLSMLHQLARRSSVSIRRLSDRRFGRRRCAGPRR